MPSFRKGFLFLNLEPITVATSDGDTILSHGYHKEIKMDVNGIDFGDEDENLSSTSLMESNFVETHGKKVEFKPWNDPQTADMIKRPRQVQSTVRMKIPNIKRNGDTIADNPHSIELYNNATTKQLLMTIVLIDVATGTDGAEIQQQNPFILIYLSSDPVLGGRGS